MIPAGPWALDKGIGGSRLPSQYILVSQIAGLLHAENDLEKRDT